MTNNPSRRVFDFYALEDRVLLSGEGLDCPDGMPQPDPELVVALLDGMSGDESSVGAIDIIQSTAQAAAPAGQAAATTAQPADAEPEVEAAIDAPVFDPALRLEVIFIDQGVQDADTLLADLRQGADQTQFHIVHLTADADGIEQITEALRSLSGVDALHLISHGDGQGLQLGNARLDVDSAPAYAGDIAAWGHALDSDADLLIYGCDLASTQAGQDLIEMLALVCDCDVAASDDITGHQSLGGNWLFEYTSGVIETQLAFGSEAQENWFSTLDVTSGLITHLEFEDGAGVIASDSVGNNDASLSGEAFFVSEGRIDNALFFPHGGSGVANATIANDPTLDFGDSDFSVAFWLNTDTLPDASILSHTDGTTGYSLELLSDGTLEWRLDDGTGSQSVSVTGIATNTWYQVTATRSGSSLQLLTSAGNQSVSHTLGSISTTADVTIGTSAAGALNFEGRVDDVRFYDRALTTSDIEALRSAAPPQTFVVTNTQDSGDGSLRQAIRDANANVGSDVITFDIAGSGTQIINLVSELDSITEQVTIDGTTQTGFVQGSFLPIVLDGNGNVNSILTLGDSADGSTIRGLVVRDSNQSGLVIELGSSENTIQGNWIGAFNSDGTLAGEGEHHNTRGILVHGNNNFIGGTTATDRNVIADFNFSGAVALVGSGAFENQISGNYFGTTIDGNAASSASGGVGINILDGAFENIVGGATSEHGNLIAGLSRGVTILGAGSDHNEFHNNRFGIGADGSTQLGGSDSAFLILDATGTIIGGVGTGNVVAGNYSRAIRLFSDATQTVIQGNYFGTDRDQSITASFQQAAIEIALRSSQTIIGGVLPGQGNVITGSQTDGIRITSSSSTGNTIRGNSIFGNAGEGIELTPTGTEVNDPGDTDSGPNELQNYAVLRSASIDGTGRFDYELDTTDLAAGTYTIDFYVSAQADASRAEGQRYLGTTTGVADGQGSFSGSITGVTLLPGQLITLVTTDGDGNSSEFSDHVIAADGGPGDAAPSDLAVTSTQQGGLQINYDGGNDLFLQADDGGAILGGLSSFTVETTAVFGPLLDGSGTLLQYRLPDGTQELQIIRADSSDLLLEINGTRRRLNNYDFDQLHDGQLHSFALSWDSVSGNYDVYVDGRRVDGGRNFRSGHTFGSGGQLIFAQERDSSGDFRPLRDLHLDIRDLRIFSDVRTANEIAASYRTELPFDEQGLVANWRFDHLTAAGTTADQVSGHNLTVLRTGHPSQDPSEASLSLVIDENSPSGTILGVAGGADLNRQAEIASLLAADPALVYSEQTGKFYRYVDTASTFQTARTDANSTTLNGISGQLATIRSAAENAIIDQFARDNAANIWLGASDELVEGQFRWYDNQQPSDLLWNGQSDGYAPGGTFQDFADGQPLNDQADRDFVQYDHLSGQWRVQVASTSSGYVVEWDADAVLDVNQALTFTVVSQSIDGAFEVDADSGQIRVADGSLLDADTLASHSVTVRVTDVAGNSRDEVLSIALNDLPEQIDGPSDLSSGISLNVDGGNSSFLVSDDGGAILGGATQVTVEVSFATESSSEVPLFSYAAGDSSGNDFFFRLNPGGTASLLIGSNVNQVFSNFDFSSLTDGQRHSLAVSWDSANGDTSVYVDGELVDQVTGFRAGTTLRGGPGTGQITFGLEQDTIGGGFQANSVFSGTLFDVRVWNQIRSEAEIALHHNQKIDSSGAVPGGLVANWQFDGFSSSGQVVDVVAGNNLNGGNASESGFTPSELQNGLSVSENAPLGTRVGFVVASQPDVHNDIVDDGLFLRAPDPGAFATFSAGQTFGDWTVTAGDVDLLGSFYSDPTVDGRFVDLNGTGPGEITQTLETQPGRQYQVIFDLTGDPNTADPHKELRVSAAGKSTDFHYLGSPQWSRSNLLPDSQSFTFTADSATTDLAFASAIASNTNGPVIGNVRVVEIPQAISGILNSDPTLVYDAATDKFYRHVNSALTWNAADAAARSSQLGSVSGQLVTISSSYENELVRGLSGLDSATWLSGTDQAVEGEFRWQGGDADGQLIWSGGGSGSAVDGIYSNFTAGEPDNLGEADFLIQSSVGTWDDARATDTASYVIQWDASEILTSHTFEIVGEPDGPFAIDPQTGEVTIVDSSQLDFETEPNRDVTVQVTDALGNTYVETLSVTIQDEPDVFHIAPDSLFTATDTPIIFEAGTSTELSVTDNNSGTDTRLRFAISVDDGVVNLSQTTGIQFVSGFHGTDQFIIDGTESDINAALDGATFTPDAGFIGDAALRVDTTQQADLATFYTFENGNATDQSGSGNIEGMFFGDANTVIDPERGEVLNLDGDGDRVVTGTLFGQPQVTTLSAFVNLSADDLDGSDAISLGDSIVLRARSAGARIQGIVRTSSGDQSLSFNQDLAGAGWQHIAYSVDTVSGVHSLFLNGVQVASSSVTGSVLYNLDPNSPNSFTHVGANGDGLDRFSLAGQIDDVRIHTRALGADEISSLIGDPQETSTVTSISVGAANIVPVNAGTLPASVTVTEDVLSPVDLSSIDFSDPDAGSSQLTVTLSTSNGGQLTLATSGQLTFGGTPTTRTITGTLGQLNSYFNDPSSIRYLHQDANTFGNGADTIEVSINDNTGDGDQELGITSINIAAVNDAPVLDNSELFELSSISEDQNDPVGNTVADIIASRSGDRISDVDPASLEGIAIQNASAIGGHWQYQLGGSTTWISVPAVSDSASLLLTSADRLRFVPDGNNGVTATINFVAWDQTSGTSGSTADTRVTGSDTAFSQQQGVAQTIVSSVNDAPTLTDAAIVNLTGTSEDTASTATTIGSILASAGHDDVDDGALSGIAVTQLSGNGLWQYSTDGTNWTAFGSVSDASALHLSAQTLVRYQPDTFNGETATFGFVAWDQTTGVASTGGTPAYADSTARGGTLAHSVQTASASIVVSDVNDAAVAIADTGSAVEAGGFGNTTAGSNATGNVLANDRDDDSGDTISVIGVKAGTASSASGNVATTVTGTYGQIVIAADGSYTYVVDDDNPIVQSLRSSGETVSDTFTYTIQDSGLATSSTQISITISGQNDAPVASSDTAIAVEAGGAANDTGGNNPTGNVLANDLDPDAGDNRSVVGVAAGVTGTTAGNVAASVTGSYGTITIASDGSYVYTVDNDDATVQSLRGSGDTLTDVFTYTVQDAAGLSSTTQVTVTIQGNNDDPNATGDVIFAAEAGGIGNAAPGIDPSGNVLVNDTDVDAGDTHAVVGIAAGSQLITSGSVGASVAGAYGSIQINATGDYTYTVDNNNSAVQALRTSGETISEVFSYTIQDAAGADSTAQITVTISGANDAPLAVVDTASAIEASGVANDVAGTDPTGNVLTNDTDVDAGDTRAVVGVATGTQTSTSGSVGTTVTGDYGTIVIGADGSYSYTLDNDNAAVEQLNAGQSLSETFSYTVQDAAGLTSTTQIVIAIDGRTDQPIAVEDVDTSEEAGGDANARPGVNPTGNVIDNDISNNGKTVVGVAAGPTGSADGNVGITVVGTFGSVVISAGGDYTYTLDNANPAVEALRSSGDQVTDRFTYTLEDEFGNRSSTELVITVEGANDAPIAFDDHGTAIESGGPGNTTSGLDATGNVLDNDTDVDAGDTKQVEGVAAGGVANPTGNVGASVNGNYGSIVINENGTYTYVINQNNPVVQSLRNSSDTLTEIFSYRVVDTFGDAATARLTVTIQGSNDTPTAVADTVNATESGGINDETAGLDPTGNVLVNDVDVDAGDTQTIIGVAAGTTGPASGNVASVVAGTFGEITIDAAGNFTYTVDNNNAAVRALRSSGQTVTDTFTYTFQDAGGLTATSQIVVTVGGANDNINAAADSAVAVEAGGTANTQAGVNPSGNVLDNDTDDDAGDTKTVSGVAAGVVASANTNTGSSVAGLYGSILIASDGSYNYVVDNTNPDVERLLSSSDTLTEVFTYSVMDTAGAVSTAQITITIQGADDAPVAVADLGTAFESGGDANSSAGSDATGNLLTNDDQVDVGDAWSVTGITAGTTASASGSVNTAVAGSFGQIVVSAAGDYVYSIDEDHPSVQSLRTPSDTLTDVFTYTIEDASGQSSTTQVTITIRGQNDQPVAVAESVTAVEAGGEGNDTPGINPSGNLLANDFDADAGDTLSIDGVAAGTIALATSNVGTDVIGNYGSINVDAAGNFTYTVDNANAAVQSLRDASENLVDVFTYTVIDASGQRSTTQVSVTIQGANDQPVISVQAGDSVAQSISETDTTIVTGGTLSVTDVDLTDVVTASVTGVAVTETTIGLTSDIADLLAMLTVTPEVLDDTEQSAQLIWNFNSGSESFDFLAAGQSLTLTYTIQVRDIAGATLTQDVVVTINGTNDAPEIIGGPADRDLTETNAGLSTAGSFNVVDVDRSDAVTAAVDSVLVSGTGAANRPGSLTDVDLRDFLSVAPTALLDDTETSASLGWNFDSGGQAFDFLSDGETLVLTYHVRVVDSGAGGLSDTETITITVTGTNDLPVATADNVSASESGGANNDVPGINPTGNVLDNDIDLDVSDSQTITGVVAGTASSASGSVGASVAGQYGFIQINSDGTFSYTVDDDNSAVASLRTPSETLADVFTYTYVDESGTPATTQISVTISGANDDPSALSTAGLVIDENAMFGDAVGTLTTTDVDQGESFTYALIDSAGGRFAIDNSGTVTVADPAGLDFESDTSHTIQVEVTDVSGATFRDSFVVLIGDVDEFGVGSPTDADAAINQVAENSIGATVGITASATDADGTDNAVTYSLVDDDGGRFTIDQNTGVVTTTVGLDFESQSSHTIIVQATSSDGSVAQSLFTIDVVDVNESPVALDDSFTLTAGSSINLSSPGVFANDTDVDGDPLSSLIQRGPTNGSLSVTSSGSLIYTPNPGFVGTDSFTYRAFDGSNQSDIATVVLTVEAVPPATPEPDPGTETETETESETEMEQESDMDDSDTSSQAEGAAANQSNRQSSEETPAETTTDAAGSLGPIYAAATEQPRQFVGIVVADTVGLSAATGQLSTIAGFDFQSGNSAAGSRATGQLASLESTVKFEFPMLEQPILEHERQFEFMVGSAGSAAGIFSIGYALWVLRGTALLTAVASGMPSWRIVDPSAILNASRSGSQGKRDDVDGILG